MTAKGEARARRVLADDLGLLSMLHEHGHWPIDVVVDCDDRVMRLERFVAERVRFACGFYGPFGRAHGGCGQSWDAYKLAGDPDPPPDPKGEHARCALNHRRRCAECAARFDATAGLSGTTKEV